jgi:acetyltransferase EpsM
MSKPVLILGTRLLAADVMDLISEIPGYEVAGFVENMNRDLAGKQLEGYPIYWIDDIRKLVETHVGVCALSTTQRKSYVEQAAELRMQTLVHPTARVSKRATLDEGCFVSAMATVAAFTRLGRCVFVNRGALIGHHTTIGGFCTIQPGANIAGAITIGEQTYVGMGAVVLDKLKIGKGCVIAAGAVVTKDLPDHVQAIGVPAKVVKENIAAK